MAFFICDLEWQVFPETLDGTPFTSPAVREMDYSSCYKIIFHGFSFPFYYLAAKYFIDRLRGCVSYLGALC